MATNMMGLVFLCSFVGMLATLTSAQQYFIVAPNVIRVDVEESVLINLEGIPQNAVVQVTLYFQMTGSNERLSEKRVHVKDFSHHASIKISRDQLPGEDTKTNKFITLVVESSSPEIQFESRQPILLSMKSGFVFIQTDKPLYTPSQRVDIRIITLNQKMFPDENQLRVDIASPDGIVVHREEKTADKGFVIMQFDFPPVPVFGNWSVKVYYGHNFQANTFVQFEVKEYVLPTFAVQVMTQQEYVLPETRQLFTHVTAKYIFGEPVSGRFHIKYGVFNDDGNLTILQEKDGTLQDTGIGYEELTVSSIRGDLESLMGKRLIIQAFVTASASGETINANNTRVAFTRTPYQFNWDSTPRFFKKGLPFAVKATIQFINKLPAMYVPVEISATAMLTDGSQAVLQGARGAGDQQEAVRQISGLSGEVFFRLDVPPDATHITLHLRTRDESLDEASNTESTFTVQPEESESGEYLLVRLPSRQTSQILEIGSNSPIEVQLTHHLNVGTLHYFVMSGGKILYKNKKAIQNANTALGFRITNKMAPVARVVAYYINEQGNVIADALLVQVEDQCENQVLLDFEGLNKINDDTFLSDGKNENVVMRLIANENTKIGVVAVDEAVFAIRNYHRLTQKKVFERMAGYDLGCGPGGGQTAAKIFKDAGVTVMTGANLDALQREELECPKAERRSRRYTDADQDAILNEYQGELRKYCQRGLRDVTDPIKFTCTRRAKLLARKENKILTSPQIETFYDCCKRKEQALRGRTDTDDGGTDPVEVDNAVVRTDFPESWMFFDVETGDSDVVRRKVTVPDSVTTWVVEAVGVSNDYLMCVAEPVKLQVRPLFFLDLAMPYSVQRMEQIEIVVTVFNYADDVLRVAVYLKGVEGLCSEAQPGDLSRGIEINVVPKKPGSVKFVIVPLEAKSIPIEVHAATNSSGTYRDAIMKKLNVRPEGYKQRDTVTITVDPANTRHSPGRTENGGKNQSYSHSQFWLGDNENSQKDIIRYSLHSDAIPGTHQTHISIMGNILGNVIDTVISGLGDILQIPRGCGEQTMITLAPNVYVYRYLKHTNQFTAELEVSAQQYIGGGITQELTHRRSDGSFSVWGDNLQYPSSTWLTAFVSKVFCQAKEFAYIDGSITCNAMRWLIEETQNDNGAFGELYKVHHQEMIGGVQGDASLTAYVLIALLECECETVSKTDSVASATAFLEGQLQQLTRPYAIAITAYALALANSNKADEALTMLKDIATYDRATNYRHWGADDSSFGAGPKPYWYINRPKAIDVEMTSYALLALLQLDDLPYSHAIVNWLTEQENYEGGFVSTQDTVIALQALSEYAIKSETSNIDINCQVSCIESQFEDEFVLQPFNAIVRQHSKLVIPENEPEFRVHFDSSGTGVGQLKFESSYHIPEPDSEKCDFYLDINGVEGRSGGSFDEEEPARDNEPAGGISRSRVGRVGRSRGRIGGQPTEEVETSAWVSDVGRKGRAGGGGDEYLFRYNIKVRYLKEGQATGMAILDVGLYTGFSPIIKDLEEVKKNSAGNIQRYEVTDRSVIFYLNSISDTMETVTFNAKRVFNVGKAQPVAIRVYDYYNPTVECVKFTHPQDHSGASIMLNTLCEGDVCACAAGQCAQNAYSKESDFQGLKAKACQSAEHFAYEVEVVSFKQKGNFQYSTMTILAPLKNGLDHVTKGANRTFWKSKACGKPELKKKRHYLVIGAGGLPIRNNVGQPSYKYIIDERMSFYEWPTGKKAESRKWKGIRAKLVALKEDLITGDGCLT
ncbi:complement C3-like [Asterias rubens]|uniref:complement C3-like n=1 Tax=Asterias rubens TaxID=7604 RepID=UPI0014551A7D|nr:complement C3-like [Asterias rubens]